MRPILLAIAILAATACSDREAEPAPEPTAQAEPTETAFDQTVDSETEPDDDGRRWYYKTASQSALYGPPNSEGMLTLRCDRPDESDARVLFSWFAPGAVVGEERVLEVRSGGDLVQAKAAGVETELGPGAMWQAVLEPDGDEASFLLDTSDPISIRLDDGEDYQIRVPASEQLRQVIRDCR